MIAFSGVRSSWLRLARNSLLCRLTTSSCRLFSSISRCRRAFWIARADWLAKVPASSTTLSGNSPGADRATTRPPRIRPPEADRRGLERRDHLLAQAMRGPQAELLSGLVVLVQHPAVGARERVGVGDHRVEDPVQVQSRPDPQPLDERPQLGRVPIEVSAELAVTGLEDLDGGAALGQSQSIRAQLPLPSAHQRLDRADGHQRLRVGLMHECVDLVGGQLPTSSIARRAG
jgi:hypothetical protein